MPVVELTPNGGTTLSLVGVSGVVLAGEGNDDLFPAPTYDEAYTDSAYTEGALLVRSRPQNIAKTGTVHITAEDADTLWGYVATWQETLEQVRKYGGELSYVPDAGEHVTYLVESAALTTLNTDPILAGQGYASSTFTLTYKPYGLLEQEDVVVNANGTEPLLEFEVPELPGSVDALGVLTLTDTANQARKHLEGGLESRYYDSAAPWPLLIDSADMTALDSATTNTALSGEYGTSSLAQTLSTSSKGIGYVTSSHVGRFRVKARVYASDLTTSVRLAYSIRGGGATFKPWHAVTVEDNWFEVDLGIASFDEPLVGSQTIDLFVYAVASTGTPTLDLDYLKVIPAERTWKASGLVGSVATVRAGRYAQVRFDSLLTETATGVWAQHPNATGSYLRIPVKGGRIAVALNRNDLESEAHTPLGDSMRADLTVIPRVALLGA